ncbi:MAG: DUF1311 domain-containing protein [Lachnospiraceae bacterium]|nr:DUF1311 domain-containing protein [Lachnospiraceae bacterium]
MRKKLLIGTIVVVLAIGVAGCGVQEPGEVYSVPGEKIETTQIQPNVTEEAAKQEVSESDVAEVGKTEVGITEQSEAENQGASEETVEKQGVETEAQSTKDLTFADLSTRQFEFSSGAGAWAEEFTIEKDGYFTGSFHDADMGDTGEGYEDGTYYISSYTGHFTDLTKVNEYTYQMKLADITYAGTTGVVEIKDNRRFVYTDSYCLYGTDEYTVYLPGTPLEELSEDVINWISMMNQSETELTMMIIANPVYGYGIYSYDRLAPLEDAQMTYDTYKESYDYYGDKLAEAATTAEMVEYTATMYEYSDDCLNYIWNLIRYNVEETEYQNILEEQRAWIKEKETVAQEAANEYEGGSFAAVAYNDALARLTIERCEELLEYLKEE